jgi:AcrR family transcriptional regulator
MGPMTEYSGAGDPTLSMQLLWGTREPPTRGPKRGLDLARIVAAAIEVADGQDLSALSMRKVAEQLGVGTMSLYRYVPGKAELLDLMLDTVYGEMLRLDAEAHPEPPRPGGHPDRAGSAADGSPSAADGSPWRPALERVARRYLAMYLRHRWILQVAISRPPLGPNVMDVYDRDLRAVEGSGLTDHEMDAVVTLVEGLARTSAKGAVDITLGEQRTGLTDRQWWEAHAPLLEQVFDPARYPLAARVGAAVGESMQAAYDPRQAFEFGLARMLDGIAALIEDHHRESQPAP